MIRCFYHKAETVNFFVRNTVKQTEKSVSPDYDVTWKIEIANRRRRIKESERL
jgi:hypothetical protein